MPQMPTTAEMEWTPTKQAILGSDPEMVLYSEVSLWFHKLELFRKGENDRMYLQDPIAKDIEIHKTLLQRLITDGEHLLSIVKQSGRPHFQRRENPSRRSGGRSRNFAGRLSRLA